MRRTSISSENEVDLNKSWGILTIEDVRRVRSLGQLRLYMPAWFTP
jgi:hypothetical protein